MSTRGKILVAAHDGTYLLRFVGDVRLTLCVAIDDFLQKMLEDPCFTAVVIDLSQAHYLDSTSLGILAKLAKETQRKTARSPILVRPAAEIMRSLVGLGIDGLFEQGGAEFTGFAPGAALKASEPSEADTRRRVIEAHRVLMALNPSNAAEFSDLVAQLEALDTPAAVGQARSKTPATSG